MRDVHENSVTVLVTGLRIHREKCAVDYGPRLTIAPGELKLDISHGSIALELRHFSRSHLRSHKIAGAIALQFLQRLDPEHLEECRIGVDNLPVERRDVDSLFQAQRQLAECVRIAQTAKTSLFLGLSGGLETAHIDASANGTSVALMGG